MRMPDRCQRQPDQVHRHPNDMVSGTAKRDSIGQSEPLPAIRSDMYLNQCDPW
jgi:hypothetical protein